MLCKQIFWINIFLSYFYRKLSEALIHRCHKCSLPFLKIQGLTEGCNTMTCKCGASQCYACREPITWSGVFHKCSLVFLLVFNKIYWFIIFRFQNASADIIHSRDLQKVSKRFGNFLWILILFFLYVFFYFWNFEKRLTNIKTFISNTQTQNKYVHRKLALYNI